MEGGDLLDKLASQDQPGFPEATVRKYFQELIFGLAHCHKLGICHRDLKIENLLIDKNGTLKISDFGLSGLHNSESITRARPPSPVAAAKSPIPSPSVLLSVAPAEIPDIPTIDESPNVDPREDDPIAFSDVTPRSRSHLSPLTPPTAALSAAVSGGAFLPVPPPPESARTSLVRSPSPFPQPSRPPHLLAPPGPLGASPSPAAPSSAGSAHLAPPERSGSVASRSLRDTIRDSAFLFSGVCGTPQYLAPEVVRGEAGLYDGRAADVWACGVIAYTLSTGFFPFDEDSIGELFRKICLGGTGVFWPKGVTDKVTPDGRVASDGLRMLVTQMLHTNPDRRASLAEIVHNPWFRVDLPPHIAAGLDQMFPPEKHTQPRMSAGGSPRGMNSKSPRNTLGLASRVSSPFGSPRTKRSASISPLPPGAAANDTTPSANNNTRVFEFTGQIVGAAISRMLQTHAVVKSSASARSPFEDAPPVGRLPSDVDAVQSLSRQSTLQYAAMPLPVAPAITLTSPADGRELPTVVPLDPNESHKGHYRAPSAGGAVMGSPMALLNSSGRFSLNLSQGLSTSQMGGGGGGGGANTARLIKVQSPLDAETIMQLLVKFVSECADQEAAAASGAPVPESSLSLSAGAWTGPAPDVSLTPPASHSLPEPAMASGCISKLQVSTSDPTKFKVILPAFIKPLRVEFNVQITEAAPDLRVVEFRAKRGPLMEFIRIVRKFLSHAQFSGSVIARAQSG